MIFQEKRVMQTFISQQANGPIRSVVFQSDGAENYSFVSVSSDEAAKRVEALLAQPHCGYKAISSTDAQGGKLLIFKGTASPENVIHILSSSEQTFSPLEPDKKFNPWKWRGLTSIIGQSGQLLSAWFVLSHAKKINAENLRDVRADSAAIAGFAALNLVANVINIVFGAQKKSDPHQLMYLKDQFNQQFVTAHGAVATLDAPDAQLLETGHKQGTFLQRNSVAFGEVFLRTLGSISLAFPLTQFARAAKVFKAEGLKASYEVAKNKDKVTFIYGLAMLMGKFTSFFASEPDPYNPEPPSAWRSFREKVAFKLSSVIEGAGAVFATGDRFNRKKIYVGNKQIPDMPGTIGNAVFVGGYAIRYTAPYGTLEVDMPELYTHAAKAIAQLPLDKQADEVSRTALWMSEHFAEKAQKLGEKGEQFHLPAIYLALTNTVKKQQKVKVADADNLISPVREPQIARDLPAATLSKVGAHELMTPKLAAQAVLA